MTVQYSSHTLFAVSYAQIGEQHTDYYSDFTKANQDFETYKLGLVGDDYHQCQVQDLMLSRALVDIPNTLSFLNDAGLLAYINSENFTGRIQLVKLDFLYLQAAPDSLNLH